MPPSRRDVLLFALSTTAGLATAQPPRATARRVALIVGVKKYPDRTGLRSLDFPEKDAHELAVVLDKLGYEVTLLSDRKGQVNPALRPTAANIRTRLGQLARGLTDKDTLVVALTGHGAHLKATDKLYFCPADTDLGDPNSLVPVDDVMAAFEKSAAGAKVLLVDACRNDPTTGKGSGDERLGSLTRPVLPDPPGGTVALFACSKGQIAFESKIHGRGFLFHYVIEGLSGKAANKKGEVTWRDLAKYVADELPDGVRAEKGAQTEQIPEVGGVDRGLVLARLTTTLRPDLAKLEADEVADDFRRWRADYLLASERPLLHRWARARGDVWRRMAEAGNPHARVLWGRLLELGFGVAADEQEAVRWFARAADQGNPEAMLLLGLAHHTGLGAEPDEEAADRWLRQAAEKGLARAATTRANLLLSKPDPPKADVDRAVQWYTQASRDGDTEALVWLGVLYLYGQSVPQDEGKGIEYLTRAMNLGSTHGQSRLAFCYALGYGVQKDEARAVELFRKVHARDPQTGICYVAEHHGDSRAANRNEREMVRWYETGVDIGDP
jgi:TPR repeat protein/uncharacterized caspase-like protein